MDYNKVIVSGRLVRDPEGKALESGTNLTTFSLASNRRWSKDGEQREEVEYHNVVVFGRQSEAVVEFLRKGNTALVEGRLKTRSWENEGVKHYRTEIIAERVIFGPRSVSAEDAEAQEKPAQPSGGTTAQAQTPYPYPTEELNPEDIPF